MVGMTYIAYMGCSFGTRGAPRHMHFSDGSAVWCRMHYDTLTLTPLQCLTHGSRRAHAMRLRRRNLAPRVCIDATVEIIPVIATPSMHSNMREHT